MAQASTKYARLQGLANYCDKDRSCKGIGSTNMVKAFKHFDLMQYIRAGAGTWDLLG